MSLLIEQDVVSIIVMAVGILCCLLMWVMMRLMMGMMTIGLDMPGRGVQREGHDGE
jgi:hypothetical protein